MFSMTPWTRCPVWRATTPLRAASRAAREVGRATYPKLLDIDARRVDDRVLVDYRLDPAPLRRASRLLVTLHRPGDEDELLLLADAQTSGGLLVVGEVPGAPVVGEVVVRRDAVLEIR